MPTRQEGLKSPDLRVSIFREENRLVDALRHLNSVGV